MGDLSNWMKRPTPGLETLGGPRVRLEPLNWDRHGASLFASVGGEANAATWDWMPVGPFVTPSELGDFLGFMRVSERWRTMVIRAQTSGEVLGTASYMRIREGQGSAGTSRSATAGTLPRNAQRSDSALPTKVCSGTTW